MNNTQCHLYRIVRPCKLNAFEYTSSIRETVSLMFDRLILLNIHIDSKSFVDIVVGAQSTTVKLSIIDLSLFLEAFKHLCASANIVDKRLFARPAGQIAESAVASVVKSLQCQSTVFICRLMSLPLSREDIMALFIVEMSSLSLNDI